MLQQPLREVQLSQLWYVTIVYNLQKINRKYPLFCQIARVGVSVAADIPYSITLRTTFYMCTPKDVDGEACVDASHRWQGIDITFAAFYQLPSLFPVSLVCHTGFPMFSYILFFS